MENRMAILQTVFQGEAVEDPADAPEAVRMAQRELRRRRRMRPVAVTAAVLGGVIAVVDLAEGTIAPGIVLLALALVCALQAWRAPTMLARLRRAEERNAALAGSEQSRS
ncbi:MAG: hypothetical protein ACJ77M_01840 [Thermoleophilaceae bacterium]